MTLEFTLCPKCHGKYLALQLDSKCKYDVDPILFHSLVWRDEHPDEIGYFLTCCDPCQESIRLLASARTHLWRHGEIPAVFAELWSTAQDTIPDWPGFKRLTLDQEELRDLENCPREPSLALEAIQEKARLQKASKFAQRMEERRTSTPGLVRPGSMSNLGLDDSGKHKVIRCPSCKEFVDASATECRFCNSLLDSKAVETAVAQRAQEKVFSDRKEVARMKVSGWLVLAAFGVLIFVPASGPLPGPVRWGIILLLLGLSVANRMR